MSTDPAKGEIQVSKEWHDRRQHHHRIKASVRVDVFERWGICIFDGNLLESRFQTVWESCRNSMTLWRVTAFTEATYRTRFLHGIPLRLQHRALHDRFVPLNYYIATSSRSTDRGDSNVAKPLNRRFEVHCPDNSYNARQHLFPVGPLGTFFRTRFCYRDLRFALRDADVLCLSMAFVNIQGPHSTRKRHERTKQLFCPSFTNFESPNYRDDGKY